MKKEHRPAMRIVAMTVLFIGIAMTALTFRCATPAKPDGEAPYITEQGLSTAEQLLYVLRLVRTLHDLRTVDQRFDFTPTIADVPFITLPGWGVQGVTSAFSRSLAKQSAAGPSPLGLAGAALQLGKSTATGVFAPELDSLISDTASGDSTRIAVYLLLDSAVLSGWDTGVDSLFLKVTATTPDTVRVLRELRDSIGDTLVTDRQEWKKTATLWNMSRRTQTRVRGTTLLYSHIHWPRSNNICIDTVYLFQGGVASAYRLERSDMTSDRWRSLAGSRLLRCTDSIASSSAVVLDSLFNADTINDLFDFADTLAQSVGIVSERRTDTASIVRSTSVFALQAQKAARLTAYREVISNGPNDTVTCVATVIDYPTKTCSLYVNVTAGSVTGGSDTTTFGIRKSSQYRYVAGFSTAFDTLTFKSLYRMDILRDSGRISSVEWSTAATTPKAYDPDTSVLVIKTNYADNDSIRYRQWTLWPALQPPQYDYACVTRRFDTTVVRFTGDTVVRGYRYLKPTLLARSGSYTSGIGGSRVITDTLGVLHVSSMDRLFTADIQGDGNGAVVLSGYDNVALTIKGDSAAEAGIPGASAFVERRLKYPVAIKRTGDLFVCTYTTTDSTGTFRLKTTFTYTLIAEQNGTIHGWFAVTDSSGAKILYSNNVLVGSRLDGQADVYGAVHSGDNMVISAHLGISLWRDSQYTDDKDNQIILK